MGRVVTGKGKGKKHYSREEQIAALQLLADNNYNYSATAKAIKIDEETLKRWNSSFGPEVQKYDNVQVAVARARIDLQIKRREIVEQASEALEKAIKKAETLIVKETRLPNILFAIKTLGEIVNNPANITVNNNYNQYNNVFEGINNQLKTKADDIQNRIHGDSEELPS